MSHRSGRDRVVSVLGHWMWRLRQFERGHEHGPPVLRGHPKYMSQLCDSPGHGPDAEFAVVLFCRSGRHRSVAWASIVMTVLRAYGYLPELDMSATTLLGTCEGLCKFCDRRPVCTEKLAMTVYEEVRTWAAKAQEVWDATRSKRERP